MNGWQAMGSYISYIYGHTKCLSPLESLRLGQFSMDIEVFNTSVDISNISNHSALHDNRRFLAILNFLNCYE